jgi:hypothetical protein
MIRSPVGVWISTAPATLRDGELVMEGDDVVMVKYYARWLSVFCVVNDL